ncbi:unnamed protein product [Amaranthus hypochondriacus]
MDISFIDYDEFGYNFVSPSPSLHPSECISTSQSHSYNSLPSTEISTASGSFNLNNAPSTTVVDNVGSNNIDILGRGHREKMPTIRLRNYVSNTMIDKSPSHSFYSCIHVFLR